MLRQVRKEFSTPILLVTHDLDECFELGDQMLVMRNGRVVQSGSPEEVLAAPGSPDVARLLGCLNVFEAEITALDPGKNTSRLRVGDDYLEGHYIPGCFRGDHIWMAAPVHALKAWPRGKFALGPNQITAMLERSVSTPRGIRLEFSGNLIVEQPALPEYTNPSGEWIVEFPTGALIVLR